MESSLFRNGIRSTKSGIPCMNTTKSLERLHILQGFSSFVMKLGLTILLWYSPWRFLSPLKSEGRWIFIKTQPIFILNLIHCWAFGFPYRMQRSTTAVFGGCQEAIKESSTSDQRWTQEFQKMRFIMNRILRRVISSHFRCRKEV